MWNPLTDDTICYTAHEQQQLTLPNPRVATKLIVVGAHHRHCRCITRKYGVPLMDDAIRRAARTLLRRAAAAR